jgi:hypothetical protein
MSQQLARDALSFAHVSKTRNAAAVIEVRADADVIDADHFHRRIDRVDVVGSQMVRWYSSRRLGSFFAKHSSHGNGCGGNSQRQSRHIV